MKWLKASVMGFAVGSGWLAMNPQLAHGQVLAVWGWRNIITPQVGGPWIAPDIRFRPVGILDGDPLWRSAMINNQALIIVTVPDEGAHVWFQGQLTQGMGKQRVFVTPSLEPGFNYSYELRVRWGKAQEETRIVPIRQGQQVFVDFSRPAMKVMPLAEN